jgi:CheY-like chemotaxis protein
MATILIVDDEHLARITVRKILERAGHRIVEAGNGVEGLNALRTQQFDLVITDIIMPDMEGVEMIGHMKRLKPDQRIIAVSGGGRTRNLDFLKMAEQHGAARSLPKPFSQSDLLQAVQDVLSQS